jgi:hypothetical protein
MILATVPVVILDLTSLESITSKITLAAAPNPGRDLEPTGW